MQKAPERDRGIKIRRQRSGRFQARCAKPARTERNIGGSGPRQAGRAWRL